MHWEIIHLSAMPNVSRKISLATSNFTSSNGILVIPDVSVDGTTNYESVTLQLNLGTGTLSILDATPKDTSFSPTALETMSGGGVKADFHGCARSGHNQLTCLMKVVSLNNDASIDVFPRLSKLFDNLSKEYIASSATAFDQIFSGDFSFRAIQGIPIEVKLIYNSIDPSASLVSTFQPYFFLNGSFTKGNFRNIDF
ncbi:hypothetical protein R2083_05675 [Nitrosomonas sp. Is35]|uniref:hypothetical protein n=2 Tax=unclassified Nitrosomonas TaxID=2609265 RepID=UPI00294B5031|nr:hypothetical protein [Nitrosomonas sp. Is35]MDV6347001.1 hypothetical protein [Nitrosomonas sp. Is35]